MIQPASSCFTTNRATEERKDTPLLERRREQASRRWPGGAEARPVFGRDQFVPGGDLAQGGRGFRRGGGRQIELDPRERRVEPSLVNLVRLGHALHRRNEIVARPEGEVVVQIVVAVNVYLRGELAIAGRLDEEVDMHRAHSMRPMACISPSEVLPG